MAQAQLNIRSSLARDIAQKLAKKHRSTVSKIVEAALVESEKRDSRRSESVDSDIRQFWFDLHKAAYPIGNEADVDLDALLAEHRAPHKPLDL